MLHLGVWNQVSKHQKKERKREKYMFICIFIRQMEAWKMHQKCNKVLNLRKDLNLSQIRFDQKTEWNDQTNKPKWLIQWGSEYQTLKMRIYLNTRLFSAVFNLLKKVWNEMVFQPAFRCCKHLKADRNTQHQTFL